LKKLSNTEEKKKEYEGLDRRSVHPG